MMKNSEIKSEKEKCFAQIEDSNKRLVEIRKLCKHEKVVECTYSYRVGHHSQAEICDYCGEFIRYI